MANNRTYACFDCRLTARRDVALEAPLCPCCGRPCRRVRGKVPPRRDKRAWAAVRRDHNVADLRFCQWVNFREPEDLGPGGGESRYRLAVRLGASP